MPAETIIRQEPAGDSHDDSARGDPPDIRLVIADVDGTLVTNDKTLTQRAIAAVHTLHEAGIAFAITSSRPPRGLSMLVKPLGLTTPLAGFNGGMFVHPDMTIIERHTLPAGVTARVIKTIEAHPPLDVWLYRGHDWFVRNRDAPHVAREQKAVQFAPTVVPGFDGLLDDAIKVVGVSDDLDAVARCEADMQKAFAHEASPKRSQPYYLDVTHSNANKGFVAAWMSGFLHVPAGQIATIGDQPNDLLMFAKSGLSIAMGNANPQVKQQAAHVTESNEEEGFANAVERFILAAASADTGRKG